MKVIFIAFCILLVLTNCTKNEAASIAFEHTIMKPWFDNHCGSCHATGNSNYLNWHYNSEDFNATFDDHNVHHIYDLVLEEQSMPKLDTLSESELTAFKVWWDNGHLAK